MKRSILALASGAFILGAAEFVMMGILPQTATAMHVSIPAAGHYISTYAIGVCVGTLILVFGRKVPPKHLIILFMAIALVGNTLSAVSFCSPMLLVARFISGLPHGAFFGTATLIAKTLADKGKEAQSVSMMVMGQTVANMLGVPAGTLLAEAMSWRLAFAILAAWALMTIVVVISWVPSIDPIKDAGIKGQFRFLTHPGPWLILLAVFFGNSGIFCWWSYVSPWLQKTGGWSATMVPMLMVLAGLGMVVGGIVGGNNNSITNCTVEGATVVVIGDNHFTDQIIQADIAECGGLVVGGSFGGSIDSCTASGTVKATGNEPVGLGGIGGCLEMMDTITNCTADVTIESENGGHAIGGLCGYAGTHSNPDICLETEGFSTKNYPSVIDNCNVTVNIKANGATHVGGLVGTGLYYYGEETVFKITNCSVKGSIDGAVTPGTVAGRAEGSTIESCTADVTIDENAGTEQVGTTTQMYESADQ